MDAKRVFVQELHIFLTLWTILYDVYHIFQNSKQLWESLEKKYKSEVASVKTFIVGKFLNFKMSDIVFVVKQVKKTKFQIIAHERYEIGC